jgi:hypothetical protein
MFKYSRRNLCGFSKSPPANCKLLTNKQKLDLSIREKPLSAPHSRPECESRAVRRTYLFQNVIPFLVHFFSDAFDRYRDRGHGASPSPTDEERMPVSILC